MSEKAARGGARGAEWSPKAANVANCCPINIPINRSIPTSGSRRCQYRHSIPTIPSSSHPYREEGIRKPGSQACSDQVLGEYDEDHFIERGRGDYHCHITVLVESWHKEATSL